MANQRGKNMGNYKQTIADLNQVRQQLLVDSATSDDARSVGYLTNVIGNLDRAIVNLIFLQNHQEVQDSKASSSED